MVERPTVPILFSFALGDLGLVRVPFWCWRAQCPFGLFVCVFRFFAFSKPERTKPEAGEAGSSESTESQKQKNSKKSCSVLVVVDIGVGVLNRGWLKLQWGSWKCRKWIEVRASSPRFLIAGMQVVVF